jgi:plastocyanin
MLETATNGQIYIFNNHYSGNNPTVYALSGTTIAFNLNTIGHPFLIQTAAGANYNTGLVHVTPAGVVTTGTSAQGKERGTLYWMIPYGLSGTYRYQCSIHPLMQGNIVIKDISAI